MSHKKAIIASDLPVLKEVLNHKNSILVKHNNESLWLRSIKKLKSKKNRKLISEKALKDFYKFTWKNRAIKVVKNL
jgi:glycosyltransferase involved in cell wall biosynthesis